MVKENGDNIGSIRTNDFYIRGNVTVPDSAIILVPSSEESIAQKENNNVNILGYQGEDVRDYINEKDLIRKLGYYKAEISTWEWDEREEVKQKYYKEMEDYGYTDCTTHCDSVDFEMDRCNTQISEMQAFSELLKKSDVMLDGLEQMKRYFHYHQDDLPGYGYILCSSESELVLSEFGLSKFMKNNEYSYNHTTIEKIILENIYVDGFLERYSNISGVQGETIVEKDIQKAIHLNKLINAGEFEGKEWGTECLQILLEHIDLNLGEYKKYLERNGIDWKQKEEDLDKMLEPLGLDCEFIGLDNSRKIRSRQVTKMMGLIEENEDLKYVCQLKKLDRMILARTGMKLAGIEDSRFEKNYTELLLKLSGKIDLEYLKEISKKGMMEKLDQYIHLPGENSYTVFTTHLFNNETMQLLSKEERFQEIKADIDDRIGLVERDVSTYDEDYRKECIEDFKKFYYREVSKVQYKKEEREEVSEFYQQVEEKENLYTTNETGKSTVYANTKIKSIIRNEIQKGVRTEERQQEKSEIGQEQDL